MGYILKFATVLIFLSSCNSYKAKYPYSIGDFKPELQKHLEFLVSNAGICNEADSVAYDYLKNNTPEGDLEKLTLSEHPVLRAAAFSAICQKSSVVDNKLLTDSSYNEEYDLGLRKNSVIIEKLLKEHLDDTATIIYCCGELGNDLEYVADFYLNEARGRTKILIADLQENIIQNYAYLENAYKFIKQDTSLNEKYYPIIKSMINSGVGYSREIKDDLIIQLAAYKKRADIPFIAEKIRNPLLHGNFTFRIIENNPDTTYFKIIESFLRYLKKDYISKAILTSYPDNTDYQGKYLGFINALAAYKNQESLNMLSEIINKEIFLHAYIDYDEFAFQMNKALTDHFTPLYSDLIKKNEPLAIQYKKKYCLSPVQADQLFFYKSKYW